MGDGYGGQREGWARNLAGVDRAYNPIRRFFPKGTDFSKVTKKAVRQVQDWMNQYPRKILGWKSAEDMMSIFMSSA